MAAFIFMVAALSRPQWGYHERPVNAMALILWWPLMCQKHVDP